ncbi:MAG: CoB--CoM heterodisulfide reductase iron-sulfur subunit B family protein [candidate division WOR-3 bacterium]|nr:CoB--CoM heterodisulfide reductase iron-sulfur subunit B family protein [candidate division WOR-3 bacterium]
MRYAIFPGCTVLGRGRNYEMAARQVGKLIGIEFVDLDDFECCGFPVKSIHHDTFVLMAAHNILAAEEQSLNICTLCSACTGSLTEVNKYLGEHFDEKAKVVATLRKQGFDFHFSKSIEVKHFAKILYEKFDLDNIGKMITRKLLGLRIAVHYGCHYLKPVDIYDGAEDPENPHSIDDLVRLTGAESVAYSEKTKCCGAGVLAISEELAYTMARSKLLELSQNSVDALVVVCPFCSIMFDDNQRKIEQKFQEQYNMPVLYYPQLLGIALGIDEKALGLRMNRVSTKKLMEKISYV